MKKFGILLILLGVFVSCRKNELGGNAQISGKVVHHTRPIPNAVIYIKFNAKEFPGTGSSRYDAQVIADAEANYVLKCYRGDYYLYATGIDPQTPPLYVTGGVPVHIRNNEKVEATIAVTEQH